MEIRFKLWRVKLPTWVSGTLKPVWRKYITAIVGCLPSEKKLITGLINNNKSTRINLHGDIAEATFIKHESNYT